MLPETTLTVCEVLYPVRNARAPGGFLRLPDKFHWYRLSIVAAGHLFYLAVWDGVGTFLGKEKEAISTRICL